MSLYITAGGNPVQWARINLCRRGVWHADLKLTADTTPSGPIQIVLGDSALTLNGIVDTGGEWNSSQVLRIKGGRGGLMGSLMPAKAYRSVPLSIPLRDVASIAQEALSGDADPSVLTYQLSRWSFFQMPCGRALTALLDPIGASWRFLPDGTLWAGIEAWPLAQMDAILVSADPDLKKVTLFAEAPTLLPGTTYMGEKVERVEHAISDGAVKTEVWFE